jgi:uncharacterized protein YjbI with pentapeptide repeats
MIPQRAPVVPRVRASADAEPLPLEHHIQQLLDRNHTRPVNVCGPAGSGKSVALQHLAAIFSDRILLLDDFPPNAPLAFPRLLVYATRQRHGPTSFEMAEWTLDDIIEYLLHAHHAECKSVMQRVQEHKLALPGNPELCTRIIDELIFDETLTSIPSAIRRAVRRQVASSQDYEAACAACLGILQGDMGVWQDVESRLHVRLLQHPAVRSVLAAESIADSLAAGKFERLANRLHGAIQEQVAGHLRQRSLDPKPLEQAMMASPELQVGAVSLLLAMDKSWRPTLGKLKQLVRANVAEAQWADIDLWYAVLADSDFSRADLARADLRHVHAGEANFTGATLDRARMEGAILPGANFSHASMAMATMEHATLALAKLEKADLHGVTAGGAIFDEADLRSAILVGAALEGARFDRTLVEDADFSAADLTRARLSHVDLRQATLNAAVFRQAWLRLCHLEGLTLDQPDFESANLVGSLLTDTVFRQANFRFASLRRTGLADVDWQGADLREADFSQASFHMGSSRSGLVNSPLASEGTRTGFYTDDFAEQYYRAPEEIRKANLRGCDLRGALVHETDWYLVDLRDAIYDEDQRLHFLRCGAILSDWTPE